MPRQSLEKLYIEQLRDLFSAEQQILDALPKMAENASHSALKKAFQQHNQETEQQLQRLEGIFQDLGEKGEGHTCKGMKGLLAEGEDTIKAFTDSDVRDAGLIAAAQRVEHYEMAGYGCARTFAVMLGYSNHGDLLQRTLEEEAEADQKLTELAETVVNLDALNA